MAYCVFMGGKREGPKREVRQKSKSETSFETLVHRVGNTRQCSAWCGKKGTDHSTINTYISGFSSESDNEEGANLLHGEPPQH